MKSAHVFHVCLSAYTNLSWLSVTTKTPDPMHAQFKPLQICFIWYFCHAGFQDAPRLRYSLYFPITLTCYLNLLVTFIIFLSWFKMVYTLKQTPSVPHREATPGSSSYGPVVQQLWSCLGGYRCWANSSHNVTRATKAQTCLGVTHRATSPFHSQLAGEQELALSPQGNNTPQQDPCSSKVQDRFLPKPHSWIAPPLHLPQSLTLFWVSPFLDK